MKDARRRALLLAVTCDRSMKDLCFRPWMAAVTVTLCHVSLLFLPYPEKLVGSTKACSTRSQPISVLLNACLMPAALTLTVMVNMLQHSRFYEDL